MHEVNNKSRSKPEPHRVAPIKRAVLKKMTEFPKFPFEFKNYTITRFQGIGKIHKKGVYIVSRFWGYPSSMNKKKREEVLDIALNTKTGNIFGVNEHFVGNAGVVFSMFQMEEEELSSLEKRSSK